MKKLLIAAAVTSALSGCAIQDIQKIDESVNKDFGTTMAETSKVGKVDSVRGYVREENTVWMPTKRVAKRESTKEEHPSLKKSFSINRTFFGMSDVAERISILTGIPVYVVPEAAASNGSAASSSAAATALAGAASMPPNMAAMNLPPMPPMQMGGSINAPGVGSGNNAGVVALSYSGTLEGFLDAASARFGVSWRIRESRIEFFKYETRTFYISAVPGDMTTSSSLSSSGGASGGGASGGGAAAGGASAAPAGGASSAGGGGGRGSISTTSSSDLSVWKSINDSVRAISSTKNVVVTPATTSVTVTDTPAILNTIEQFIEKQNAHMTKQVVVNVRVLSVTLNNSHDYGLNWAAVYAGLSDGLTYRFLSGSPTPSGSSSLTAILGKSGDGSSPQGMGSQAIIQALSKQGNVSTVTSGTSITLNNQPVPMRVGRQISYIQSVGATAAANVGTTTTITPGTLNTGFSMNVLPNIQSDGKLLMQYDIDISSLLKMSTFTSGEASVQTPELDTRTFMQRIAMRSGETIVMSGFEQTEEATGAQGIGDARNLVMGGTTTGTRGKSVIVILLTANVIDKI